MQNGYWNHHAMMDGYGSAWYWLMSFHGIVFLVFLLVSVVIGFDLYREWHRGRSADRRTRRIPGDSE
jgi:hypothetical protein